MVYICQSQSFNLSPLTHLASMHLFSISAYLFLLCKKIHLTMFSRFHVRCAVRCLVAQSCPTLCDPLDCSLAGSSVHGESPGRNTGLGCHALLQEIFPTQGLNPGLPHCSRSLPSEQAGKLMNPGVGSLSLLQAIFPTRELKWDFLLCRRILSHLSYQGSPIFHMNMLVYSS